MIVVENPLVMLIEECIHLRDAAQRVLSESLGGNALSRLEGLVLLSLTEAGRPLTASQIGRNIGHARQVVLRAVNHLSELDLVEKSVNPDHKTAPLIAPTRKGRNFERQMGRKLTGVINSALSDEQLKLCRRLQKDIRQLRVAVEQLES